MSDETPATHCNLTVRNLEDGRLRYFRVNRKMQLQKLMNAYCERMAMDPNTYVFLFHGSRIRGHQTPIQLEMEDEDEIEAFLHQQGGSTSTSNVMSPFAEHSRRLD